MFPVIVVAFLSKICSLAGTPWRNRWDLPKTWHGSTTEHQIWLNGNFSIDVIWSGSPDLPSSTPLIFNTLIVFSCGNALHGKELASRSVFSQNNVVSVYTLSLNALWCLTIVILEFTMKHCLLSAHFHVWSIEKAVALDHWFRPRRSFLHFWPCFSFVMLAEKQILTIG